MKLTDETRLFDVKWTAYRSKGYKERYREQTEEKELKEYLYNAENFTADIVMKRSGFKRLFCFSPGTDL